METIGLIGAGKQALWQVRAAYLVRPFKRAVFWSRREEQATALAKQVESLLRVSVSVAATIEEAVAPAQLVVTTTASRQPLLTEAHLHPALHSDAKGKRELSDGLLRNIALYVPDDLGQCRTYGELQSGVENDIARAAPLGHIIAGKASGRQKESDITVADLTGLGVQDTAIAIEAYRRLRA